jgi:hypothetical protein
MKIYAIEPPKRPPTKVMIQMTDTEACQLNDLLQEYLDDISDDHVFHTLAEQLNELVGQW